MQGEWLIAILLVVAPVAKADPIQARAIRAGQYEQLLVGVASDGQISGVYQEEQGDAPAKACRFFVSGDNAAKGDIPLLTRNKESHSGWLTADEHGVTLTVPGARDYPGCGLVLPPLIDTGMHLTLTDPLPFVGLVRVGNVPAPLYSAPVPNSSRLAALPANSIAGVFEQTDGWLRVRYRNPRGVAAVGWVKSDQAKPPLPEAGSAIR